jgi:hypothetical protein
VGGFLFCFPNSTRHGILGPACTRQVLYH